MSRKKLTVHRKRHYRDSFMKDIQRGAGIKMRRIAGTAVRPATYKIEDVGALGRGKKIIPPMEEGELGKHGFKITASTTVRRRALSASVREDGYRTVLGRILALEQFFKRTKPRYSKTLSQDRKWLVKTYGERW